MCGDGEFNKRIKVNHNVTLPIKQALKMEYASPHDDWNLIFFVSQQHSTSQSKHIAKSLTLTPLITTITTSSGLRNHKKSLHTTNYFGGRGGRDGAGAAVPPARG